jgi:hypothetical protein
MSTRPRLRERKNELRELDCRSSERCWPTRRNIRDDPFKTMPGQTRLPVSIKSADQMAQVRQHLSRSGFVLPTDAIGAAHHYLDCGTSPANRSVFRHEQVNRMSLESGRRKLAPHHR